LATIIGHFEKAMVISQRIYWQQNFLKTFVLQSSLPCTQMDQDPIRNDHPVPILFYTSDNKKLFEFQLDLS
jgi:hypothetical protein